MFSLDDPPAFYHGRKKDGSMLKHIPKVHLCKIPVGHPLFQMGTDL